MEGEEIWKDVPGYEGRYRASSRGRICSIRHNGKVTRPMNSRRTASGYYQVRISGVGKQKLIHVHHLVMLAFVGPRPEGMEVNHINGNRSDNRAVNLEYRTHAENIRHARYVLKSWDKPKKRNYCPPGKLNADIVREIKRAVASKEVTQRQMALRYNVTESMVSRIIRGERWGDVEP